MKSMKKWVALFMAAAMMLSLVGCTSGDTGNKTSAASAQTTAGTQETEVVADDAEKTMTIGLIPQSTLFVFYDLLKKYEPDYKYYDELLNRLEK